MKDSLKAIATRNKVYFQALFDALPNPNKLLVSGGGRIATVEDIKLDPHVSSYIQSRTSGVTSQLWEVQSTDDDKQILELVQMVFDNLPIRKIIEDIVNAPLYGYQPLEVMYVEQEVNGKLLILPTDVVAKPFSWFLFDKDNILKLRTLENQEGEDLPPMKFLCPQNKASYNNPYGESVLSKCLWSIIFKKGGLTFWVKFTEKFGMPHFVGKTDKLADSDDFDEFVDMLDELVQDGSAVISTEDEIEVLSGASSISVNVYKELLSFCNAEISKAILSQTLTTDIGNTGSYAAAQTHDAVRMEVVDADKSLVQDTFNLLIRWIVDINFGKNIKAPKFVIYQEEDVDAPLADVVQKLASTNQIQFTEQFFTSRFGFKKEEFRIVNPKTETSKTNQPEYSAFNENNSKLIDQMVIDNFVDQSAKMSRSTLNQTTQYVVDYLKKKSSLKSALSGINKLLPKMDSEDIETKLINMMFMADVIGRLSVKEELENAK